MKHKIIPDDDMSRAIYNLAYGDNREYLEHFISLFTKVIYKKSLDVCIDVSGETEKSFDRGYVKGLKESLELLVESYKKGERIQFGKPEHKQVPPKKF